MAKSKLNPLVARGMDYYCPNCDREMYVMSVASMIKQGGTCPWCGKAIRAGSTIPWGTLSGKVKLVSQMTDQHISNCIYMLKQRVKHHRQVLIANGTDADGRANLAVLDQLVNADNTEIINIFKAELRYRKVKVLPYKPYYSKAIEARIMGEVND